MTKSIELEVESSGILDKIEPTSKITFHPLVKHYEDGDFIVGSLETGEFIILPELGIYALDFLQKYSVEETTTLLKVSFGIEIDIFNFIHNLLNLGFVKTIDGLSIYEPRIKKSNLNWLKAQHVRFLFNRTAKIVYTILIITAFITIIRDPQVIPIYKDFFWTSSTSLVLVGNTIITIANIAVHELAHLLAARSLNLSACISLSTRLHNLVVQTDVSGLWSVPRKYRYRVYLAGIVWELTFCSIAILVLSYIPLIPLIQQLIKAVILTQFLGVVWQFYFYMRTDIYFVIKELLKCRNLFTDSIDYLKFKLKKSFYIIFNQSLEKNVTNPLDYVPIQEKGKIVLYSHLMLWGSIVSLWFFMTYNLPVVFNLLFQAYVSTWSGILAEKPEQVLDGLMTLLIEGSIQLIFLLTLFRRYRTYRMSKAKRL